ncbi:hypothetical protein M378DRAFT_162032 [Amanita muscaria Koide BX008]|uniref:Uncharacterized protein n=1 Tax=Amanita muscaria (strain Koide BX008) TaxID=946122 RepID=A0A0C2WUF5_AMAMK|nr:hypothetical protein M378DRAFT_162032 [Amanita muscaria Koide BX008]
MPQLQSSAVSKFLPLVASRHQSLSSAPVVHLQVMSQYQSSVVFSVVLTNHDMCFTIKLD